MVGGDRRSPPRHRGKGGGGGGKGKNGGGGIPSSRGSGGDNLGKSASNDSITVGLMEITPKPATVKCVVDVLAKEAAISTRNATVLGQEGPASNTGVLEAIMTESGLGADVIAASREFLGRQTAADTPIHCESISGTLQDDRCPSSPNSRSPSSFVFNANLHKDKSAMATQFNEYDQGLRQVPVQHDNLLLKEVAPNEGLRTYARSPIKNSANSSWAEIVEEADRRASIIRGALRLDNPVPTVPTKSQATNSGEEGQQANATSGKNSFSTPGVCHNAHSIKATELGEMVWADTAPNSSGSPILHNRRGLVNDLATHHASQRNSPPNPHFNEKERPNAWAKPKHILYEDGELGRVTEDGTTVMFDESAFNMNLGRLRRALVGKIIGRKFPFDFIDRELHRRWECYGDFQTVLIEADCFICIFESLEARDAVLLGGPWQVAGHIIGMDKWTASFKADSLNGLTSPVWIRLPRLPLLFWDKQTIGRIATMIGTPIMLDAQTGDWGRSTYARVCVRLDLSKRLPAGVWVNEREGRFFQKVEYEGISVLCFKCGIVGHKNTNCPTIASPPQDLGKGHNSADITFKGKGQQQPNNVMHLSPCGMPSSPLHSGHNLQWEKGESSAPMEDVQLHTPHTEEAPNDQQILMSEALKEDFDVGPWTMVSRRKWSTNQRSKNHASRAPGRYRNPPQYYNSKGPPARQPNAPRRREPSTADCPSSTDPGGKERKPLINAPTSSATGSFPEQPNSCSGDRSDKDRVSKAHFEKELLALGPIADFPRKRKKRNEGSPDDTVATHLTNSQGQLLLTNTDGGDGSPLVG